MYAYNLKKKFVDNFFAVLLLFVLSPVLLLVSLILRFTGEGEIFYHQRRIGFGGKEFFIMKFATMLKDSPNIGTGIYTAKNDDRILPFGHFLRKTKINELPQLINVLKGEMSFVGPRPLIKKTYDLYSLEAKKIVSSMRPGITSIASIFFRNEEEMLLNAKSINLEEFYKKELSPKKELLEKWYFKNQSFFCDIKIILLTFLVVMFQKVDLLSFFFKNLPNLD